MIYLHALVALGFLSLPNSACTVTTDSKSARSPSNWTSPGTASRVTSEVCSPSAESTTVQSHDVVVGAAGRLQFDPIEIDADVGDIIRFDFLALNHSLTQSSLSHPCVWAGGFSTGFNQFNPKNIQGHFIVEYEVTSINSQWFYCAQTSKKSHCQGGMVFALNAGDQLQKFVSVATGSSQMSSTSRLDTSTVSLGPTTISQPSTTSTLREPSSVVSETASSTTAASSGSDRMDHQRIHWSFAMFVGWAVFTL